MVQEVVFCLAEAEEVVLKQLEFCSASAISVCVVSHNMKEVEKVQVRERSASNGRLFYYSGYLQTQVGVSLGVQAPSAWQNRSCLPTNS